MKRIKRRRYQAASSYGNVDEEYISVIEEGMMKGINRKRNGEMARGACDKR